MADTSKKADKAKKPDAKAKKEETPAEVLNINELGSNPNVPYSKIGSDLTTVRGKGHRASSGQGDTKDGMED